MAKPKKGAKPKLVYEEMSEKPPNIGKIEKKKK